MERVLKLVQNKRARTPLILLILAIIIWFGGPYVAIAGDSFFATVNNRLIGLLILALFWGFNNLRRTNSDTTVANTVSKPENTPQLSAIELTPLTAEIKQFKKSLQTLITLIKKNHSKTSYFTRFPTYLVLGTTKSGKSSLLATATQNNEPLAKEKYYDGWLANQTVFLDYLEMPHLNQKEQTTTFWLQFINTIKRYRFRLPLRGIILTLNLPAYFLDPKAEEIEKIFKQIQTTAAINPQLPIYLLFTHCDLISGFTDFFEDLSQEERAQAFGFALPSSMPARNMRETFTARYNELLQQLNQRLIWCLHQEHNQQKRIRIKDFPLQLEVFKEKLTDLATQIGNFANIKLQGCYFTSNTQDGTVINFLNESLEKVFALQTSSTGSTTKHLQNKNYFISQWFTQLTNNNELSKISFASSKFAYTIYATAAALILTSTILWYENYKNNIAALNTLQQALNQAQNLQQQKDPYAFLPTLTALYTTLDSMNSSNFLWRHLKLQQAQQLQISAHEAYEKILIKQFLPILKHTLENKIQNTSAENSSELYSALKSYLMLDNLSHRDTDFLQQWFAQYWQQTLPPNSKEQAQLQTQLNVVLHKSLLIATNPQLINTTRNILSQIPLTELSYSVLLDHYHQPIKIFDNNNALNTSDSYSIPSLYTAANFNVVYNVDIVKASDAVINGNWILGQKQNTNSVSATDLAKQVQALYLTRYAAAWQQLLDKTSITDSQNLSQVSAIFTTLSAKNSPIQQLLHTIYANTNSQVGNDEFALVVSAKFQALNDFSQSPAAMDLHESLNQMKNYLAKINNATNSPKAAFLAAQKRMKNNSENDAIDNLLQQTASLPQPLLSWLNPLATESWHLILADTQNYINQAWQETVLPEYNANINNKYPLFKNASSDTDLSAFANFFSPQGTLNTFFKNYLEPFVDTHTVYWTWRILDNDHLAIPQTTLEMFIRASLIQKMYFANGDDTPLVKFTLLPLAIEPGVADFNLNLEGQIIDYQPNQPPQTYTLMWPGPIPNKVSMRFTNSEGKQEESFATGPWAFFKLLDKASLQTMPNNPKQFKVTFDLNGNSAKYGLLADNLVNPFIPGIATVFRCPPKL